MALAADARDAVASSSPSSGSETAVAVSGLLLLCCERCLQLLMC